MLTHIFNLVDIIQARLEEAKTADTSKSGGRGSPTVKAILRAAKKGGPLEGIGVLGRLGDLGTVAEEYDVAVSTACGMLDYIVVQTTAGVQRCLNFLREHNLGRANFLPLDKMQKGAHDRVVETPEGAPRLFELIQPVNSAVAPAMWLAVKDTLVAPDMETASRWAYDFSKRWRVVTMDGKLIETSGTMTGGGKSVKRGGMKLSVSHNNRLAHTYVFACCHSYTNDISVARVVNRMAANMLLPLEMPRQTRST